MASAKLYVSTNVVDRLTRPINSLEESHNQGRDESIMQVFDESFDTAGRKPGVIDAATYIGSLQTGIRRSSSGSAVQTPRQGDRRNRDNDDVSVNSANRSRSRSKKLATTPKEFEHFLERQKLVLKKREENVKQVNGSNLLYV